jgi:hypothetical protein
MKNPKEIFKQKIRQKTTSIFGRLENGYVYHHYTEPYEYDKFIILEKDFHSFYEGNKNKFKLGGLR